MDGSASEAELIMAWVLAAAQVGPDRKFESHLLRPAVYSLPVALNNDAASFSRRQFRDPIGFVCREASHREVMLTNSLVYREGWGLYRDAGAFRYEQDRLNFKNFNFSLSFFSLVNGKLASPLAGNEVGNYACSVM